MIQGSNAVKLPNLRAAQPGQGTAKGAAANQPAPEGGAKPGQQTHACPTRVGGTTPLFQHRVTVSQCQSKQRGLYHKCFTCSHANGR